MTIKHFGFVLHAMETLIPSWDRISVRGEATIGICKRKQPPLQGSGSEHPVFDTAHLRQLLTNDAGEAGVFNLGLVKMSEDYFICVHRKYFTY